MQLDRSDSVDDFLAKAGAFLADREAEHNLILGITSGMDPDADDELPYMATLRDGNRVVAAAALRTPPYNLILSEVDDPGAIQLLVQDLHGAALPGVVGPPAAASVFAALWAEQEGKRWEVAFEERIYQLSQLRDPSPAAGGARLAVISDRGLLEAWMLAFTTEALDDADAERVRLGIDDWARGGRRRFWLWEVDGRPVSMVGAGGNTPNGIRIGPVYTPPADRGRGFASNLTAAVSRTVLDEGRRFCFLYTNVANPTANGIYQAIGYEPVTDALMVRFAD
jgi:predicted GNAT family acetyltransferase